MRSYSSKAFKILCSFLTIVTITFILSLIGVIVIRGIGSLTDSLLKEETLFAIQLSIRCSCISTFFCFLLALPTSYVLTRCKFPLKREVEVILELTMSLPLIVIGLALLIVFSSTVGKWLKANGFPVVFNTNGIIIAQLSVNLPFAIKMTTAAFRDINPKLERIAGLLGATPFRQFYSILLPLAKNSLISAVILVWSRALGEFGATLMLVGVTRMKTETLPASIYLGVSVNDLSGALASALILMFISAVSLFIANCLTHDKKKVRQYD